MPGNDYWFVLFRKSLKHFVSKSWRMCSLALVQQNRERDRWPFMWTAHFHSKDAHIYYCNMMIGRLLAYMFFNFCTTTLAGAHRQSNGNSFTSWKATSWLKRFVLAQPALAIFFAIINLFIGCFSYMNALKGHMCLPLYCNSIDICTMPTYMGWIALLGIVMNCVIVFTSSVCFVTCQGQAQSSMVEAERKLPKLLMTYTGLYFALL